MIRIAGVVVMAIFSIVGLVAIVPAEAVVFTIDGGVVESGGITTPCSPCTPAGATGIPLNTQGYTGQNPGGVASALTLEATPGTIIFNYLGSDAALHNQFKLDTDNNGTYETVVYDNKTPSAFLQQFVYSHTSADHSADCGKPTCIPFEYVFDVGGSNTEVKNGSSTFNNFLACVPNAGNPKTCSQGFIGLADGTVFNANDDHQDLGVAFRTPEPTSLTLLGAGLLGLGLVTLRRRKI